MNVLMNLRSAWWAWASSAFLIASATLVSVTPAEAAKAAGAHAVVKVDVTEVRAGPNSLYVSRGRAYRGDSAPILRQSQNGAWLLLKIGGMEGWVAVKHLNIVRGEDIAIDEKGDVDHGRDRRRTNYEYDDKGRRLNHRGQPVGSGEGTTSDPWADAGEAETPSTHQLILTLGFAASQFGRTFSSNIGPQSFLAGLQAQPQLIGAVLTVDYLHSGIQGAEGLTWGFSGLFEDQRFGETVFAAAALNEGQPLALAVDIQNAALLGRLAWRASWGNLGLDLGVGFFRSAFQETQPVPIFVNTMAIGMRTAAYGEWVKGAFTLGTRLVFQGPLSVSQAPVSSGELTGSGYAIQLYGKWSFSDELALFAKLRTLVFDTDAKGGGEHIDTVSVSGESLQYTTATQTDSLKGFIIGVEKHF